MLSQFYAVFLGIYLSCETNFIMQGKFSCVPGDSHMGSPSAFFIGIGDRDYIVLIRDVFHFKQKDAASGAPQHNQVRMSVKTRPTSFSRPAIDLLIAGSQTADGAGFQFSASGSKNQIPIIEKSELSHLSYNSF